jgi:hypothetical protein
MPWWKALRPRRIPLFVTPAKAGAQGFSAASLVALGPGFRRDDELGLTAPDARVTPSR